ncbi:MAG TPA: non-canonical purine NTP pyrophosphatase, RdgB/HAM1 family [Nitrosomonas nitrosa]|jgi:XTP/dITP diphosphohydrolase|uniref:dITP/XTP pyrophosphatase n=1 Tax=Nitrosomonas nitrosa TaxID=52442 RepID=A0A1I4SWW4_9PROT|nr:RdgB/HAM1 family non-canonical purine NTP pyrophosphatase [Nitrosomonas nitrosa]MCO6435184.1 RdgB/HAM1 family non-canonical purine NTP pyrophosphatase [Nitrosomonas nitrosa]CAE6484987.1 dITP/XTP pyrophosphatase [Nitrosomonas nitrosa]SFM68813.1 XTP/dITP diphosphohydrolase [Nitrosomonas nitrosa]HBZ30355.1 non-canonical purine NTP pyrophosphatase, RdgB/HAM1 family [Nitrosomonas nitrosa]HNP51729.1 RdgB/HAM1 family non-canonical purine NTP pyrophosphatase [Nitrosomonas nitrosa]
MRKLVIASNNAGKLKEIQKILLPFDIEAVSQANLGVTETDEPFETFVENALAKARHASRSTKLPSLADDSGICVSALGGAPGVHSARYAGEPKSDERNNQKLTQLLKAHVDRRAYYYCAIVLIRHADDPQPIIVDGSWHGEIVQTPRGEGGFGYDPYFFLPDLNMTAAELPMEQKNAISHRGKALRKLGELLTQYTL